MGRPEAAGAPGHQFVPFPALCTFTDDSGGPHSTGTSGAWRRGEAPTVGNLRVAGSRPGSGRAHSMRQVRRAICRVRLRPKADGRAVAMTVKHFDGRRTGRSSPLSLVLHKCQMNRREPRREQAASRSRFGSRRWSTVTHALHSCHTGDV